MASWLAPAVDLIAAVPDHNGNVMMYEDDAERIIEALKAAGWRLIPPGAVWQDWIGWSVDRVVLEPQP